MCAPQPKRQSMPFIIMHTGIDDGLTEKLSIVMENITVMIRLVTKRTKSKNLKRECTFGKMMKMVLETVKTTKLSLPMYLRMAY